MIPNFMLTAVANCLTSTLGNTVNYTGTLQGLSNSACLTISGVGIVGVGLDAVIFFVATFVLSGYLRVEQAAATGSFLALIAGVLYLAPSGLMSGQYIYLFLAMMIGFIFLSTQHHANHPMD